MLRITAKISMCGRKSNTLVSSNAFTSGNTYKLTVSEFNKPNIISPAISRITPVAHTEIQPYFSKAFLLFAYGNSMVNTMSSPYGKVKLVGKTEESTCFQLVRNIGVKLLTSKYGDRNPKAMRIKMITHIRAHKISELLAIASIPRKQLYETTRRSVKDIIPKGILLKST